MDLHGGEHVLAHHLEDAPRAIFDGQSKRLAELAPEGLLCRCEVELHRSAEEETGIVVSKYQIGVRHRRLVAAEAITGRTRHRAGALRSDLEETELVDMGDAAAACADLDELHHRDLDRKSAAFLEASYAADLEHVRFWPPRSSLRARS